MNGLLWKQWHETKGYLAIFIAWMTLAVCYVIAYEIGHHYRAVVGHFSGVALFYCVFSAIVLAMRTACGEQADGTIAFSASLPVSMRRIATVRIVFAVATLAIPILIAAGILSLTLASGLIEQAVPRSVEVHKPLPQRDSASLVTSIEQLWSVTAIAFMSGAQLLLLLSLFGCYLRSQAQIGLLGAVLALGSMITASMLWLGERNPYAQLIYGVVLPQSLAIHWGYGDEHGGYTDHEQAQYRWIAMGLALLLLAFIGRLFVTRYGRYDEFRDQEAGGASASGRRRS